MKQTDDSGILRRHPAVALYPLKGGGYGVFSREAIGAGTLIEECHYIAIDDRENRSPVLSHSAFWLAEDGAEQLALVFGFGALYRHADAPNLVCHVDDERGCFVFTTLRPVAAGEQLCIDTGRTGERTPRRRKKARALEWNRDIEVRPCAFGMGVFATVDLPEDVALDEAPFLLYRGDDCDAQLVQDYIFHMEGELFALVGGYGSIFNHADRPNVAYFFDEEKNVFFYCTTRAVRAGEQLFISYGEDWWRTRE